MPRVVVLNIFLITISGCAQKPQPEMVAGRWSLVAIDGAAVPENAKLIFKCNPEGQITFEKFDEGALAASVNKQEIEAFFKGFMAPEGMTVKFQPGAKMQHRTKRGTLLGLEMLPD